MNQSIPLYLNQPEIVWTAWEAIGTVSAVCLTLLLLLGNRILKELRKPHIKTKIQDWKYIEPKLNEKMKGRLGQFEFSLLVKNACYLWLFGDDIFNLKILWWLDTKEEGMWTYQNILEPIGYIPKNETWLKNFKQQNIKRMPIGKYKLILKYLSIVNDKMFELGTQSITFSIPSENNRIKEP